MEKWTKIRILIASRIFGFNKNGKDINGNLKGDETAFVPYADMLNHRKDPQTKWFFCSKRNGFVIKALEDIPRGSEICDTYGFKSNAAFFINYGFLIPDNQQNVIDLAVEVNPDDEAYQIKKHIA